MELNYTLLLTLFLTLIIVSCDSNDSEVKGTPNTVLDTKNPIILNKTDSVIEKEGKLGSVLDSNKVDPVKNGKDQVGGLKKGVETQNVKSKEAQNVDSNINDNNSSVKDGEKKEKIGGGLESRKVPKEGTSLPIRKEVVPVEECDSSNRCMDEKKTLVACLRVPGDESPDLLLLIQNKGKGPLSVTIFAPDFVLLEKKQIHLQEKEDKKVKVSIKNRGSENFIIVTAGNGNCSLDFRDLIGHNTGKEADNTPKTTNIALVNRTHSIAFISFALLLVIASVLTCITLRRKHFARNGNKYQKLDMELPVSGGKIEVGSNDEWDNSWGDNWDDEEAPSMPATPNLSSRGVASRRFNKEGWKD